MNDKITVEICAQSITSALIAQEGGANRIELCMALEVGGLTPSPATITEAVKRLDIPVCVLVRPRAGDFYYSDLEYEMIKKDILFCKENGVAGVVVGILHKNKELDIDKMTEMLELARPMQVACHRAFDQVPDAAKALEQLIEIGYDRVLTCGQAENVVAGKWTLQKLVEQAKGRIAIMPGNGVTPENALDILTTTKAKDIHLTAKHIITSPMRSELEDENSVKDAIDNNYSETNLETVKRVVALVKSL